MSDILERDEAITVAIQALNDWAVTYASDMCDEATIEAARARILKHGTLAYTANAAEGLRRLQAELSSLKACEGTDTDTRPRYSMKPMRDEIAKAKAYARAEALEEAANVARCASGRLHQADSR